MSKLNYAYDIRHFFININGLYKDYIIQGVPENFEPTIKPVKTTIGYISARQVYGILKMGSICFSKPGKTSIRLLVTCKQQLY